MNMSTVDSYSTVPPVRLLVLWCPDWPVVAACLATGVSENRPAAVFADNRVVACSAVARAHGVRRGMLRRQAQSKCPELAVFTDDEERDARFFESVAAAVEELIIGVEVVRPGIVAVPARGAAGYFGGERELVEILTEHVSSKSGVECQIGVADGLFAATLAARTATLVGEGSSGEFLAPMSINELDQPDFAYSDLVDLLRRLGLNTLGAFADLAERDVVSRFGKTGLTAHRLAKGKSERPLARRNPQTELSVTEIFDPVLDRVDTAAFLAKTLASRFHSGLAARGLACTRLGIYASTENDEELVRVWRCAEPLTPRGIADRVRWQFEGWLRSDSGNRPTAGVTHLQLVPEETVAGEALQLVLWEGRPDKQLAEIGDKYNRSSEQAGRSMLRVQGLLGPEGVYTAVLDGGRGPRERVRLVPWGDQRVESTPQDAPWPGRLPPPSPATVFEQPVTASVIDSAGFEIGVTDRNRLTNDPDRVSALGCPPRKVIGWAGPWSVDTQWWSAGWPGRITRVQVLLADERAGEGVALLLTHEMRDGPIWTVEGVYD